MSESSSGKFRRHDNREVIVANPDYDYPFIDEDVERWRYELDFDMVNDGLHLMIVDLNGFTYEIYCVYNFDEDTYSIISVTQCNKKFS